MEIYLIAVNYPSFRQRAKANGRRGPNFRRGPGLFIDTRSSRSPASDATMSNSPVRRASSLASHPKPLNPRRSLAGCLPAPVTPASAPAAPARQDSGGPGSIGPCSIEPDSNGPGSNGPGSNGPGLNGPDGPASLDSLPSVQRVGASAPPFNEGGQRRMTENNVLVTKKREVTLKHSLTLVEQSGRPPLSRRSYTLVEQYGTSAWI